MEEIIKQHFFGKYKHSTNDFVNNNNISLTIQITDINQIFQQFDNRLHNLES